MVDRTDHDGARMATVIEKLLCQQLDREWSEGLSIPALIDDLGALLTAAEDESDRLRDALRWALPLAEAQLKTLSLNRIDKNHVDGKARVSDLGLRADELKRRTEARAALRGCEPHPTPVSSQHVQPLLSHPKR